MKDIFLPPGVQRRLYEVMGACPRRAPNAAAKKIEALWRERNAASESDLAQIDEALYQAGLEEAMRRRRGTHIGGAL